MLSAGNCISGCKVFERCAAQALAASATRNSIGQLCLCIDLHGRECSVVQGWLNSPAARKPTLSISSRCNCQCPKLEVS